MHNAQRTTHNAHRGWGVFSRQTPHLVGTSYIIRHKSAQRAEGSLCAAGAVPSWHAGRRGLGSYSARPKGIPGTPTLKISNCGGLGHASEGCLLGVLEARHATAGRHPMSTQGSGSGSGSSGRNLLERRSTDNGRTVHARLATRPSKCRRMQREERRGEERRKARAELSPALHDDPDASDTDRQVPAEGSRAVPMPEPCMRKKLD